MKRTILLLATILAFTIANAQEKTSMSVSDLQKTITKHISKNYAGYKPIEAYKIDTKGIISYEVVAEKTPNKLDLYFDKDGKFIRKEVEKKTPTTKTTPPKTSTTKAKTTPPKTTTTKAKITPKTNNTIKPDTTKQDTLKK